MLRAPQRLFELEEKMAWAKGRTAHFGNSDEGHREVWELWVCLGRLAWAFAIFCGVISARVTAMLHICFPMR